MKKLWVEKVELGPSGHFFASTLIEASEEQIAQFKSKPCNHSLDVDKLIYDEPGWPYDSRFCGVCNSFIGLI